MKDLLLHKFEHIFSFNEDSYQKSLLIFTIVVDDIAVILTAKLVCTKKYEKTFDYTSHKNYFAIT